MAAMIKFSFSRFFPKTPDSSLWKVSLSSDQPFTFKHFFLLNFHCLTYSAMDYGRLRWAILVDPRVDQSKVVQEVLSDLRRGWEWSRLPRRWSARCVAEKFNAGQCNAKQSKTQSVLRCETLQWNIFNLVHFYFSEMHFKARITGYQFGRGSETF